MYKGMLTDLDCPQAPVNGTQVTISRDAFVRWMRECEYPAGNASPFQEVHFIWRGATVLVDDRAVTPNWHVTAMTTFRNGGNCRNFHFKIEVAKAASHYWHYVVYDDGNGNFVFVGDMRNGTNEGGGGANGDHIALRANKSKTAVAARPYSAEWRCTKRTQQLMLQRLQKMVRSGWLNYNHQDHSIS